MLSSENIIQVPELSLVVVSGVKSYGMGNFIQENFLPSHIVDFQQTGKQAQVADNFAEICQNIAKKLEDKTVAVIDITRMDGTLRQKVFSLAKDYHAPLVGIFAGNVSNIPAKKSFFRVYLLPNFESSLVQIIPLESNYRHEFGPFDIIGDVHGCLSELLSLLTELDYCIEYDENNRPVNAYHTQRKAIFVGDLVDRGPNSSGVLRLVMGMVSQAEALAVPGNHEEKLLRGLHGRPIQIGSDLKQTLNQISAEPGGFQSQVVDFLSQLPHHLVLDQGKLVVAHAGLPENFHGRDSMEVANFSLRGKSTGEIDEFGYPVRYPWALEYQGNTIVIYGHTPMAHHEWVNNTLCVDTGCVFGGTLSALRYPECQLVSIPAQQVWSYSAKTTPSMSVN